MSLQPQHDRGDRDHRQIVHLTLLVAGRDPAELLEPIDRPLHPVTLPVRGLVEAALAGLVGLARDHRPDPTAPQLPPDARVAVALVTGHRVRPDPRPAPTGPLDRPRLQQAAQHGRLVALPGGHQHHHRLAVALHPQVQLGGVAAAAAAQRLPIDRLVRIGGSPPCAGRPGRPWRAGAAPPRRAGGPAPPTRRQSAAASPARRGHRRRPATRPGPGPTRPGGASGKSGWPPSPRAQSGRAGPATARRRGPATRSLRRPAGGLWAAGPCAAAGAAAVGPARPTAHRRVLGLFVPWARILPIRAINIANTP